MSSESNDPRSVLLNQVIADYSVPSGSRMTKDSTNGRLM